MVFIQAFPKTTIQRKCNCTNEICVHIYYFVLRINKEQNNYETYSIGYYHESAKKLRIFLKPYPVQSKKSIFNAYRRLEYKIKSTKTLRNSFSISLDIKLKQKEELENS